MSSQLTVNLTKMTDYQKSSVQLTFTVTVTVTVTEALVLRPLLEDRGRITESIRILVPVDRMKQKCFQITVTVSL